MSCLNEFSTITYNIMVTYSGRFAYSSQTRPCYKFTDPALARSASSIKDRLLNWVKAQTKEYKVYIFVVFVLSVQATYVPNTIIILCIIHTYILS